MFLKTQLGSYERLSSLHRLYVSSDNSGNWALLADVGPKPERVTIARGSKDPKLAHYLAEQILLLSHLHPHEFILRIPNLLKTTLQIDPDDIRIPKSPFEPISLPKPSPSPQPDLSLYTEQTPLQTEDDEIT